jgi:pyruvate dehydrogenase E2 component (dihydrolipoamide acetyltransferase)
VQRTRRSPVGADLAVIGDGAAPQASGATTPPAEQQEQQPNGAEAAAAPEAPSTEAPVQAQTSEGGAGAASSRSTCGRAAPRRWRWRRHRCEKVTMPALGESVTEGTVTRG